MNGSTGRGGPVFVIVLTIRTVGAFAYADLPHLTCPVRLNWLSLTPFQGNRRPPPEIGRELPTVHIKNVDHGRTVLHVTHPKAAAR